MEMTISNTRGAYFTDRQHYIEGLQVALAPLRDFDAIRYGRFYSTEEEFIKISDTIGSSAFLNITALSKAEILKDVAKMVLQGDVKGIVPSSLITDKDEMRRVAPLFR